MSREISTTAKLTLCAALTAALVPVGLAQAAAPTQRDETKTICAPEEGMATGTGFIYGGPNGRTPSDNLAMGRGCVTLTPSGSNTTIVLKVRADAAVRKDKDSAWVPAKDYGANGRCEIYRLDKNGNFSLNDHSISKSVQHANGEVDTCELTASYPTSQLRNLQARWGVDTSTPASAYVSGEPISLFARPDAAKWQPGTVCDPSDSSWITNYSEDGSRSVTGRGCVTTAKDGNQVRITATVTGRSWVGPFPETNYNYQIRCSLRKRTSQGWDYVSGASGSTPVLNDSGTVTGCSLNKSVPADEINLYELSWGFGRSADATPSAAAEVQNSLYPLYTAD